MKTENQPYLSVVLPCYNPLPGWRETLESCIRNLDDSLPGMPIQYIISNDGSTHIDRAEVAALSRIPHVVFLDNTRNEGKGAAIRKGTLHAAGEIIIYTDIDFPFGTDPIVEMIKRFEQDPGCWFIYGNRSREYFRKLPLKRRLFSKCLHLLNRLLLGGRRVIDTQAGIKGMRRQVLPDLQSIRTNSFVFEVELMRKLIRKGIRIEKVEVSAQSSIVFTDFSSKVLFREAINFARITILSGIWNDLT